MLTPKALKILCEDRKLDPEILSRFGIESVDRRDGSDWIMIPVKVGDEIVNRKYRTIGGPKKFSQEPDGKKCFWNFNALADASLAEKEPIVITEGEFDCIAAIQSGWSRTVSVPDGAPAQPLGTQDTNKYTYIEDAAKLFGGEREIILATDNDGPGVNLMNDLALRFGAARCKWVKYPWMRDRVRRCKDLNEVLVEWGENGVSECLRRAEWRKTDGVYIMSDLPPIIEKPTYPCGIVGLDDAIRFRKGDFCVVTGVPSHGKELSLNTPLPTPSGWTTMGSVKIGDVLFDEQGMPCRVTGVTPVMFGKKCFDLRFRDGSSIISGAEHNWLTSTDKDRRSQRVQRIKRNGRNKTRLRGTDQRHKRTFPSVKTTAEIAVTLRAQGKWNHQITNAKPLMMAYSPLTIDPYVLGAWLGDGDSKQGVITVNPKDNEILREISKRGFFIGENIEKRTGKCPRWKLQNLTPVLEQIGVRGNKHIPANYLRASIEQRIELLRGLMDTDGYCHADDGTCEFTNTNKVLADNVYELVSSLGIRASMTTGRSMLNGVDHGEKYRIQFQANFPVFHLERKTKRQKFSKQNRVKTSYRTIVSCDEVMSVPVRCISVDSPSRLYLAGKSMIPTHNTSFVNDIACRMTMRPGWRVGFASFEQQTQTDHRRSLRTWFLRGDPRKAPAEELAKADDWIDKNFRFMIPSDDDLPNLEWALEKMSMSVVQHECDMLVIDPWNELDHTRPPDMSLTEYTGFAIKQFKRTARMLDVFLAVLAHPTKMKREDGKYLPPGLYDISDCYSEDMEVLTRRGWLRHSEIKKSDKVMCFNPADEGIWWSSPSRIVSHDYDGEMFHFSGYGYDLLVSPNHRMLVKPAWEEPRGTQEKTGIGRPVKWEKEKWSFVMAKDLPKGGHFRLPKAAHPNGKYNGEIGFVDYLGFGWDHQKNIPLYEAPANEFCEFIGWWLAEGCWQSSGVSLCQSVGKKADRIDYLLKKLKIKATRAERKDSRGYKTMVTWYIGVKKNRGLVKWIRRTCGKNAAHKKIPRLLFKLDAVHKMALLNGFIDGDGHRPTKRKGCKATTISKALYDDLQRIAIECGIPVCGHVRKSSNKNHSVQYQVDFGRPERREVTVRGNRNMKTVPYKGKIYCLTVPTGAYFVRRNGKVSVSGNSAHWANKADLGITIFRPDLTTAATELYVTKARYQPLLGKPGKYPLQYLPDMRRYECTVTDEDEDVFG